MSMYLNDAIKILFYLRHCPPPKQDLKSDLEYRVGNTKYFYDNAADYKFLCPLFKTGLTYLSCKKKVQNQ